MKKLYIMLLSASLFVGCNTSDKHDDVEAMSVEDLAVTVQPSENRQYSYTDKKAGFWYGFTHSDTVDVYSSGWNIAKRHILSDYALYVDGCRLLRRQAEQVTVSPDILMRQWDNAVERFAMLDRYELLSISVSDVHGDTIAITVDNSLLKDAVAGQGFVRCTPVNAPDSVIKIVPMKDTPAVSEGYRLSAPVAAGGFLIAYGTEEHCDSLIALYRSAGDSLLAQRRQRMNEVLADTPLHTNLDELDRSLAWLTLTTDELVTEQQGHGIYAGLPWFNEYWGRDMFISMPGATLVTGQFAIAKDILRDFAALQDRDTSSVTCGRIPNRANPDGILYNTADGTPRFVIEVEDYLKYSGNYSFLADVYPAVVLSIDQSIDKHTDANGYLMHEDADTWMDVKRNGVPGSPRGNRANDIQYLWYAQLKAGVYLAQLMDDNAHAVKWNAVADTLARNFEHDYCDKKNIIIYDHLNTDGTPDMQYRPNQLYCFDLIRDTLFKQCVTRRVWEELVYPWGVASLAQWDPQFHPQHENWHYYHKDDAYHNGTVWLWNNGMAMQRMIEYDQVETAWQLFCNMNRQALHEGAVGSLSENADAHPREGASWAARSGTFLQAWSNAEQLRVWYQYFLGIRPDMMNSVIVIEPKLPAEITELETSVRIGHGVLHYRYRDGKFDFSLDGDKARLDIILPEKKAPNPVFEGVSFCKPSPLESYPCFSEYHEEALTY